MLRSVGRIIEVFPLPPLTRPSLPLKPKRELKSVFGILVLRGGQGGAGVICYVFVFTEPAVHEFDVSKVGRVGSHPMCRVAP